MGGKRSGGNEGEKSHGRDERAKRHERDEGDEGEKWDARIKRCRSSIDEFDKVRAKEAENMLPPHVSICDSSDEDALLGKSESEEGDDEKLDDYLSMHTDRMHEERGIGGSSSDDLPSTLNPDAPEFVPRGIEAAITLDAPVTHTDHIKEDDNLELEYLHDDKDVETVDLECINITNMNYNDGAISARKSAIVFLQKHKLMGKFGRRWRAA